MHESRPTTLPLLAYAAIVAALKEPNKTEPKSMCFTVGGKTEYILSNTETSLQTGLPLTSALLLPSSPTNLNPNASSTMMAKWANHHWPRHHHQMAVPQHGKYTWSKIHGHQYKDFYLNTYTIVARGAILGRIPLECVRSTNVRSTPQTKLEVNDLCINEPPIQSFINACS
jgi:hypothetical protein